MQGHFVPLIFAIAVSIPASAQDASARTVPYHL
jgi:hypothetical protein